MSKLNKSTESKASDKKKGYNPRDSRSFPDVYSTNYYFVNEEDYKNDGYTGC